MSPLSVNGKNNLGTSSMIAGVFDSLIFKIRMISEDITQKAYSFGKALSEGDK